MMLISAVASQDYPQETRHELLNAILMFGKCSEIIFESHT